MCQHCKIILIEANTQNLSDLATAENEAATLKATEISNSFGFLEVDSTSTIQSAFNHPGIVITASSGDDGFYDYDYYVYGPTSPYNQANIPAAYPTVVAVGGTSLYLGQTAQRQSETVWNDNGSKGYLENAFGQPLGAGGGGCSTRFDAQGWQSHLGVWSSTACGARRLVSDISAVADPVTGFDIYDTYACATYCTVNGWGTIGGTSLASPLIAAMYGLAGGSHGVSYPALTLYGHLGTSALYDVTAGGNGYCDGAGAAACGDPNTLGDGIIDCDYPGTGTTPSAGDRACDALSGYDGATGVGTPNGLKAFAKTGPAVHLSGPTSVSSGSAGTWKASASDPFAGGSATTYTWSWGDGSANSTTSTGSASHTYKGSGTKTLKVTARDNYGQTGSATYSIKV